MNQPNTEPQSVESSLFLRLLAWWLFLTISSCGAMMYSGATLTIPLIVGAFFLNIFLDVGINLLAAYIRSNSNEEK